MKILDLGAVEVFIGDESAWKNNASLGNEWHKVLIPLRIQPHPFRVIYLLELAYKYLYELNPSDNANYSVTDRMHNSKSCILFADIERDFLIDNH